LQKIDNIYRMTNPKEKVKTEIGLKIKTLQDEMLNLNEDVSDPVKLIENQERVKDIQKEIKDYETELIDIVRGKKDKVVEADGNRVVEQPVESPSAENGGGVDAVAEEKVQGGEEGVQEPIKEEVDVVEKTPTSEIAETQSEPIKPSEESPVFDDKNGTNDLDKAKELVNSGAVKNYTAEVIKEAANSDETQFKQYLNEIAEQAMDEKSRATTIKAYGQELVDIAERLYEKPNEESPILTEQPKIENKIEEVEKKDAKEEVADGSKSGYNPKFKTANKVLRLNPPTSVYQFLDIAPLRDFNCVPLVARTIAFCNCKTYDLKIVLTSG
jgi:hypothetical protein